jgi:hypothetical protein
MLAVSYTQMKCHEEQLLHNQSHIGFLGTLAYVSEHQFANALLLIIQRSGAEKLKFSFQKTQTVHSFIKTWKSQPSVMLSQSNDRT